MRKIEIEVIAKLMGYCANDDDPKESALKMALKAEQVLNHSENIRAHFTLSETDSGNDVKCPKCGQTVSLNDLIGPTTDACPVCGTNVFAKKTKKAVRCRHCRLLVGPSTKYGDLKAAMAEQHFISRGITYLALGIGSPGLCIGSGQVGKVEGVPE